MATESELEHENWILERSAELEIDPATVLERERLQLSSPDTVYEALSKLPVPESGRQLSANWFPTETVKVLLARQEPLIDLAIARFVCYEDLYSLYQKGGALRLAVLSNRAHPAPFVSSQRDFAEVQREFFEFMEHGSVVELKAFFTNPAHGWLSSAIRGSITIPTGTYNDDGTERKEERVLSEDRHMLLVKLASMNPRLQSPLPEDDTWDEFVDNQKANEPVEELWRLLIRIPATRRWASILGSSFSVIRFVIPWSDLHTYPQAPADLSAPDQKRDWHERMSQWRKKSETAFLELITSKWASPPEPANKSEYHSFDSFFWLRQTVVARYCKDGHPNSDVLSRLRDHSDQAVRCGYYAGAIITPEFELQELYDRDGDKFLDSVVENNSLYLRANASAQKQLSFLYCRSRYHDGHVQSFKSNMKSLQGYDPERYGPDAAEGGEEESEQVKNAARSEAHLVALGQQLQEISYTLQKVGEASAKNGLILLLWITVCSAILWFAGR